MPMDSKWQALTGFTPMPSTGIISVKGIDAKTFLQGQLTVNLNTVTLSQSQLGAHCNLKGRMQSLFRIIQLEADEPTYLLLLPKTLLPEAIKNLKKYAIFSKVTLSEVEDLTLFGVIGEMPANDLGQSKEDWIMFRMPGKVLRHLVIVPNAAIVDFQQAMQRQTPLTSDHWELLEIQAGIPTVYPQTIDALLPHHVNLPSLAGVSFDKGCYLGQEIIARMHYKGKIKRHMYLAQLVDTVEVPSPGDDIVIVDAPNEAPGIVVRAAKSVDGFLLLIVLDEQFADFENIRFKKADGPKLHRLDLSY